MTASTDTLFLCVGDVVKLVTGEVVTVLDEFDGFYKGGDGDKRVNFYLSDVESVVMK